MTATIVSEDPVVVPPSDAPATRRLRASAALLAGGGSIDVQRVLMVTGAVAIPLGFLLIVLGYWGAAEVGREVEQTPYLISGGLLGLALVVTGGFAYFGYWLTRVAGLLQKLVDDGVAGAASTGAIAGTPALVATPRGSLAHRAECPVVADRTDLVALDAGGAGRVRCKLCQPAFV